MHTREISVRVQRLSGGTAMKAIYIPVGATGHILSSLPMVGELVARGVETIYFAPESCRAQVELSGAHFHPIPAVAARGKSVECDQDFIAGLPLVFLGEADGVIGEILPVARAFDPDIVIADELALAGRLVAAALHKPLVMVFTSFAPCERFSICRYWPAYTDDHPARAQAREIAQRFTRKYGVKPLDIYEIFEGLGDLNISTLIRAFQPAGDSFGDNFLFAGAQIGPRAEAGSWQPPQDGKPLLYTSLGSLFNNWPEFYQMLFPVVRELDLHVLCALGKALTPQDLSDIPANVTLLPFAPQLDVLAHADYFITHAGTGSAMEALYYGVPCVCIPQMDEQILTARQMVRLGVASTSMVRAEVTEDSLRDALLRLMREPHYRERARAMSRQMRETGGSACAANAIIDFIKAKT